MGYDPIEANQAASMALSALRKTIDLDKYGIGEAIFGLFGNGGGSVIVGSSNKFWDDVATDRVLRMEMTVLNMRLAIDQCVHTHLNDIVMQVAFSFTIADGEQLYTVSASLTNSGTDTKINVKVS